MSRSPLDNPEIKKLFCELAPVLIDESDRGAVLIGTSHVDERLIGLFEALVRSDSKIKFFDSRF
jgi:hypothetical protein